MNDLPLRERILLESYSAIDYETGMILVGVLFDYRVVLSSEVSQMTGRHGQAYELSPLEPQAAAELVANLFNLDPDDLFLAFHRRWSDIRRSGQVGEVLARLAGHRWVESLDRCDDQ